MPDLTPDKTLRDLTEGPCPSVFGVGGSGIIYPQDIAAQLLEAREALREILNGSELIDGVCDYCNGSPGPDPLIPNDRSCFACKARACLPEHQEDGA